MKNPYMTDENTVISFSGGRTSAYMLYRVLDAYKFKLPEHIKVCFANTGKEMPETLDFVQACSNEWGVDIVWLERSMLTVVEGTKNKYNYETIITNHKKASRNGEPFASLMTNRPYAPNPVARFCTVELKIRAIKDYLVNVLEWETPYVGLIGIRADEVRRAAKMQGTVVSGQERYLPLFVDGITKEHIGEFWQESSFDLELPNNKGVTDWGNCDLCFLKGLSKKMSIIRERPELADWWIEQEEKLSLKLGKGAYFRADQPNYAQMKVIATTQQNFDFLEDDETIPCFCGD
tara:strand:+ start:14 stop:886 length:873 start_codon:yes stop_codon:yes gene_type:complete